MEETVTPCQQLVQRFVHDVAPKIEGFKQGFDWKIMFELLDDAIQAVEEMKAIQGGAAKKACATEMILAVYDAYKIDIPFLPTMLEKQALKFIIGYAIDGIVAILNKRGIFVHDAPQD